MKIKLTRNTVVDGKAYEAGRVVNAKPETAIFLINIGKAEPVKSSTRKKATNPPKGEKAVEPEGDEGE